MSSKERDRIAIIKRCAEGELSASQAALLLRLKPRQVFHLKARFAEGGEPALLHGNRNHVPANAFPPDAKAHALDFCRDELARGELNFAHLTDLLAEEKKLTVSDETLRRWLRAEGLGPAPRKLKVHRRRRKRKAQEGEMLFIDGSPHHWFGEKYPASCLLLCSDDATGDPLRGLFVEHENLAGVFEVCFHVFSRRGLPLSFYVDRASWAKVTKHRPEGAAEQHPDLTNWQIALRELGVAVIHAHSPQARGRGERLNGSFQGRLAAELVRQDIHTLEEATRFLNQTFIPRYARRFHKTPVNAKPAWRKAPSAAELKRTLSVRVRRTVANDNCVSFNGQPLQLLPTSTRRHFVRAKVEVRKSFSGALYIIHPTFGELPFHLVPRSLLDPLSPSVI